jgi:hypothetical protein
MFFVDRCCGCVYNLLIGFCLLLFPHRGEDAVESAWNEVRKAVGRFLAK